MTGQPSLTKSDVLTDPLIRQLMRAEGVSPRRLSALMETVSARLAAGKKRKHSGNPPAMRK